VQRGGVGCLGAGIQQRITADEHTPAKAAPPGSTVIGCRQSYSPATRLCVEKQKWLDSETLAELFRKN
jgi:hypothetical protein